MRTIKKKSWRKQMHDEICDISKVLYDEGHSTAECSYAEIVATILLLIEDHLSILRMLGFFLLGAFFAHLL